MLPSEKCRDLVKKYEGFRPAAYLCPAGVPTIGYGFTDGVKLGDTMTQKAADSRLLDELRKFGEGVYALCSAPVTQNGFDALVSLAYNIGLAAFSRSSVLRLHNAGAATACGRAFARWNKSTVGGKLVVLPGLTRRRAEEAALYLSVAP